MVNSFLESNCVPHENLSGNISFPIISHQRAPSYVTGVQLIYMDICLEISPGHGIFGVKDSNGNSEDSESED
ncbi:unnamed protein product [Rhizophagus irregularis]|nr:unnamed protein product [Rhizophagus irregularis]